MKSTLLLVRGATYSSVMSHVAKNINKLLSLDEFKYLYGMNETCYEVGDTKA